MYWMFICVWVNVLVNTFTSIRKQSLVLYIDDNTNSFTSHSHWLVLVVFLSFTIPDSIFAVIPVQRRVRANERTVLALTVNMNIDWEFIQSDCGLYVFICVYLCFAFRLWIDREICIAIFWMHDQNYVHIIIYEICFGCICITVKIHLLCLYLLLWAQHDLVLCWL